MLRAQLLFFFPLALVVAFTTWLSRSYPSHQSLRHYLLLVVGGWLGAACLLYLATSLLTPSDGLKDLPVLLGAYALPVAAVAVAVPTAGKQWSPEGRVLLSVVLSAAAAIIAPFFLLLAACTIQANCL
jgi:hypothetical protein